MEAQETSDVEYLIRTINEEGKVVYKSANLISSNDGATVQIDGDSTTEGSHENMQIMTMEVEGDPQVVGKDIILELCRICGGGSDRYIHVFDDEGLQHDLRGKIHRHLPLKVSEGDSLPLQICYNCATTLLAFDDMHKNCLNTQTRLRDIVSKFVSKTSNAHHDTSLTNDLIATLEGTEDSKIEVIQDDSRSNGVDELFEAFSPETSNRGSDAEDDGARPDDFDYVNDEEEEEDDDEDENSKNSEQKKSRKSTKRTAPKKSQKSQNPVQPRLYQCGACEQFLPTEDEMMDHISSAHSDLIQKGSLNPIMFECATCCRQFGKQAHLLRHMKRMHSGEKPKDEEGIIHDSKIYVRSSRYFHCDTCDVVMNQRSAFVRHLRLHSRARPAKCDECDKTFRVTSDLKRHKDDVHRKIKRHPCDICGTMFAAKGTRDAHRRIHTGEKPFPCPICFKYFRSPNLLGIHKKTHTDYRPWKCTHCEKAFRTKQKLETHLPIHTGIKPYVCEVCLKSFPAMGELNRHKSVHTEERPYECLACGMAFRLNRYLKSHVLKVHKKNATKLLAKSASKK